MEHLFDGMLSLRAATMLELAGGASLPNGELRLFLGESLIQANAGREADGRRILLDELARSPSSPDAANAWFLIAIASNRLRDFQEEKRAYDHALALEWDVEQRAKIYMNRGETKMALGDLRAARVDYERALSSSNDSEIFALANWGLGVALSRDNELSQALERVGKASALKFEVDGREVTAIDLPMVYFTPDYEIHYYRALGDMALAQVARDPEQAFQSLKSAASLLRLYLAGARPAGDKWIEQVERYALWCDTRIAGLKRRPGAAAARRAGSD